MIRFWDFKLTGAPPLLSLVGLRQRYLPATNCSGNRLSWSTRHV